MTPAEKARLERITEPGVLMWPKDAEFLKGLVQRLENGVTELMKAEGPMTLRGVQMKACCDTREDNEHLADCTGVVALGGSEEPSR